MTEILKKIHRLSLKSEQVAYRWCSLGKRIASAFYRLSDVRLQALHYGNNVCELIEYAPVINNVRGTPSVSFHSSNVYSVVDKNSFGVLVYKTDKVDAAVLAPARHVGRYDMSNDNNENRLNVVKELATYPYLPVVGIVKPSLFRIAKDLSSIRVSDQLRDTVADMAMTTEDGFVVPFEFTLGGGLVLVDSSIVSRQSTQNIYNTTREEFDLL